MRRTAIFLDDGGVMNDNAVRGPQWQRLVAAFFAPRLGGDPAAWAGANRLVATALFADYSRAMRGLDDAGFNAWLHGCRLAWVRSDRGDAADADFALAALRDLPAALDADGGRPAWSDAAGGQA